ncbi:MULTISPECIES: V-type ATP synthase subunit D [unclassified Neochlamydia]|uniref:V-type ATP synthase subunit D n=1 Tax=unclassified Neochlamydia TaxID=2643326 RepID=UPI001BC8FC61|nr:MULTISPECIES: V-type ATP synthase subunit D [unclassified Neochlamydia]MBS4166636.1 V-type ATP synthase subunit D [Neochlamydia sp. AcF65]
MAEFKLTKNELRMQQNKLAQLQKYLPTLQLKKAMLQVEVNEARSEILKLEHHYHALRGEVKSYAELLSDKSEIDPMGAANILAVHKHYENIAGVEVPYFEGVDFADFHYSLFDTPPWLDGVVLGVRGLAEAQVKIDIAQEKRAALENELREVAIRVNLFEKILIPRALGNIKKIKVFLGDQQLAAVSRAKVAKSKIEGRKKHLLEQRALQAGEQL